MVAFISLEHVRDIVIIGAGSLAILAFAAFFIVTVVLGLTARTLLGTIRTMLSDDVTPLMKTAQATVQRVQGTTTFIGETAVSPIIRGYGVVAGTRRAFGVLAGITRRRRNASAAGNDPSEAKE